MLVYACDGVNLFMEWKWIMGTILPIFVCVLCMIVLYYQCSIDDRRSVLYWRTKIVPDLWPSNNQHIQSRVTVFKDKYVFSTLNFCPFLLNFEWMCEYFYLPVQSQICVCCTLVFVIRDLRLLHQCHAHENYETYYDL